MIDVRPSALFHAAIRFEAVNRTETLIYTVEATY